MLYIYILYVNIYYMVMYILYMQYLKENAKEVLELKSSLKANYIYEPKNLLKV